MKKIIILFFLWSLSTQLSAQIETHYYPNGISFLTIGKQINIKESRTKVYSLSRPDVESFLLEDEEHYKEHPLCFRYGRAIPTNYTLKDGEWQTVENGRVWSFTIEAEGALSLDLGFSDISLSDDACLFVINKNNTMVFGPIKQSAIKNCPDLFTDNITGNSATIYLYEPNSQKGECSLTLSTIVYGYRNINEMKLNQTRSDNEHIDVSCRPSWLCESDAVGLIKFEEPAGGSYTYAYGSGALVMTTNSSFAPYYLTAYHNLTENTDRPCKSIKFFYRTAECGSILYCSSVTYNDISVLATWYDTDMALLKINDSNFGENQRHAWLGWDRSGSTPYSGATIHHPGGDLMKIAIDYNTFTMTCRSGSLINRFWGTDWDEGFVEPGSSGAPLLDQNKRVVGQLYTSDSKSGMFHLSWTGGGTSSSSLSYWLDPIGSGQYTTNTKRQHSPQLSGPTSICQNSTALYTITDLPPNSTIVWSFSSDFYGPTAPSGHASGTTCSITNNCQKSFKGTLIAKIMWDGSLLTQLEHPFICYSGFYGQYTSDNLSGTISYSPVFYVKPGFNTAITSPNLIGATVSYDNSGTTPLYFQHDPTLGKLQFTMPTNNGGTPVIINVYDVCGNQSLLYAMPQNSYYLSISYEGSNVNISLNEEGDALKSNSVDQAWSYEIRSATRGDLRASGIVNSRSTTISTAGWPKGIYIIKATIGKEETTEKIIVR